MSKGEGSKYKELRVRRIAENQAKLIALKLEYANNQVRKTKSPTTAPKTC